MSLATRLKVRNDRLHSVPCRFQVDREDFIEIFFGEVHHTDTNPPARVVDPHINVFKTFQCRVAQAFNLQTLCHVGNNSQHPASTLTRDLLQFVLAACGENERISFRSLSFCEQRADAFTGTSNDDDSRHVLSGVRNQIAVGLNVIATPFMQWRRPVGFGPSLNTWPR